MVGFSDLAGGELFASSRYTEDVGLASGQSLAGFTPSGTVFRAEHPCLVRNRRATRRLAALPNPPLRSAPLWQLRGLLPAATGGAQFLPDEPFARRAPKSDCRLARERPDFRSATLAEPGARSAYLRRRRGYGSALRFATEHSSAHTWPGHPWRADLVGIPGRVASRDARGAGVLYLPLALPFDVILLRD